MFACLHAPGNAAVLRECAAHFSPLIEETSPDTVVFDVRGLGRLFGTTGQLAAAIVRRVGIPASLALAANPDAAVHAALGLAGVMILPAGGEAAALAPLPLLLLGGSPEVARNLHLWGVRTFGEFAALPPLGVVARLGEEGAHLQRLAAGAGHRELLLRYDPVVFRTQRELEDSIEVLESLLFLVAQMLEELCERLRYYGRATNALELRLKLERAGDHITRLALPVPMLNAKVLLKLVQLELQERAPQAPVAHVALELTPVEPRATQHGLFLPSAPEPEKFEITLARIRALVGAGNVGAPEMLDTHRPDAVRMTRLVYSKGDVPLRPKLALRRFRPPRPAQVWCSDEGRPARVVSAIGGGTVVACAGPWTSSGDWWTPAAWERQEWDVEILRLGVFRMVRDGRRHLWALDGNYD